MSHSLVSDLNMCTPFFFMAGKGTRTKEYPDELKDIPSSSSSRSLLVAYLIGEGDLTREGTSSGLLHLVKMLKCIGK